MSKKGRFREKNPSDFLMILSAIAQLKTIKI